MASWLIYIAMIGILPGTSGDTVCDYLSVHTFCEDGYYCCDDNSQCCSIYWDYSWNTNIYVYITFVFIGIAIYTGTSRRTKTLLQSHLKDLYKRFRNTDPHGAKVHIV